EEAAVGHDGVVTKLQQLHAHLTDRLAAEAEERQMRLPMGSVIRLDDYLATRLVELTVHADDLAVSVGVEPPRLPFLATTIAIETLVAVARHRHGDIAVLRALARRARDDIDALRALSLTSSPMQAFLDAIAAR